MAKRFTREKSSNPTGLSLVVDNETGIAYPFWGASLAKRVAKEANADPEEIEIYVGRPVQHYREGSNG